MRTKREEVPISPATLVLQNKRLLGSFMGSVRPRLDLPRLIELYQPVAKVVTAFDRPCIPADCVAIGSHTPGMLPPKRLVRRRRNGLGARATFTTDCYRSGRLQLDEMITRRYTLEQLPQAFEDMEAGRVARGVIVFGSGPG